MAIAKADVVVIAPELAAVDEAVFTAFIADSALLMDLPAWGARADIGQKYLVAHLMSRMGYGTSKGRGAITGETVGSVSRQYAQPQQSSLSASELSSTRYGALYATLRRQLSVRLMVVG